MVDTDYITKESALSCFHDWIDRYGHEHTADEMVEYQRIEDLPVADVRPMVRGKWKHDGSDWKNRFICDQCGYKWFFNAEEAHFCPNCGADMTKTEKEEKQ